MRIVGRLASVMESTLSCARKRWVATSLVPLVAMTMGPIARADAARAVAPRSLALPTPVSVRSEPEGVTHGDPAFEPLPGARADFGRLGGSVYQIEVPREWNGRLVLFMHGFEEFGPEADVTPPDFRRYLIARGYAWGASSFSSTSLIPGRAADETAALWDLFARKYRRPTRTYATGLSMGGLATHISAERYANRYDGGLALCGNAGQTPGLRGTADYFAAGAYAAGVTKAEYDSAPDISALIQRIRRALQLPTVHRRFENIMLDLTGGPRAFDREGFELEEETNWRRTELAVSARIAPNRRTTYRLGSLSPVSSREFNRAVIRLPDNDTLKRSFAEGSDLTGRLRMPLVSMHTTGDGQVPIEQARILQRRVDAAGRSNLLVQRVVPDASHCGFTTPEAEAGLEALVRWVEHGDKPKGTDVMVHDLRRLDRTFELTPRPGSQAADAVPGARDRVVVRGKAMLDGVPFDARYLGAVVRRNGLVTPCNYTLPPVDNGRYEITVLAAAEAHGCGGPGAEILLWTYANGKKMYSADTLAWPRNDRAARFEASFSSSAPGGAATPTMEFSGEVSRRDGHNYPPGTRVEAYVGRTRCGVASVRRTGNYAGYILSTVGSDSIPGCEGGATLTFRIDGRRAPDTAVNELGGGRSLDLTV